MWITALIHGSLTALALWLVTFAVAEWWGALDEKIRQGTHSDISEVE